MDRKKLFKILSPIAILAMVASLFAISQCTSCQTVFNSINEMEEGDFQLVEQEIYLVTKLGCAQLFKSKSELAKTATEALAEFVPYIDTLDSESVSFISKMVEKLSAKIIDPELEALINIAFLQIKKYGGLQYVEKVDLGTVLSDRSVRLIQALVKGILDAAEEVTESM